MSESLRMPYDQYSAKEVMEKFTDLAYSVLNKDIFQEAINILYGREYVIKCDYNKRMQFFCQVCMKDMSSERAVLDHFYSGAHQKNLNKETVIKVGRQFQTKRDKYSSSILQHQLYHHSVAAVGLHLVEEYRKSPLHKDPYYKCNLCVVHGNAEAMLNHLVRHKHTEKYIRTRCRLISSIIPAEARENIRLKLVDIEAPNPDQIRKIVGMEYFPYKWIADSRVKAKQTKSRKAEADIKDRSLSPVPGTSTHPTKRTRSPSGSHASSPRSESPNQHVDMLMELDSDISSKSSTPEKLRNPDPPTFSKTKVEKEVPAFNLEDIAIRLNHIVKTMPMQESVLMSDKDARAVLELMQAISYVLNTWERSQKSGQLMVYRKRIQEKIFGQVVCNLRPLLGLEKYYPTVRE